jgi:DNA-binding beta-propeller fold protein YncE
MFHAARRRYSVFVLAIHLGLLPWFTLSSNSWLGGTGCEAAERHLLYVAAPGVRNYLEYGGHGLLVFDIDEGHKFVKRIPTGGLTADGKPVNVKGICASAKTGLVHISTLHALMCLDLTSEELLWERTYDQGCDRMALSPDGETIYLPSLERDVWYVVRARTGDEITRITTNSRAHNTLYGPDGRWCYLAGLGSPLLSVADTSGHTVARTIGPFSASIRPFTINSDQSFVFVCINDCLGFEVGDLRTGRKLARVDVTGYQQGPVKRHGCPSHGIGLTPDESQLWVCDAHNQRMHVFDATVMPPRQIDSIPCRDEPGWITFSMDGRFAYPSSGDVFDVTTRKLVAQLTDEEDRAVGSEKMVEIVWSGTKLVRAGDQFGIGRKK